MMSQKWSTVIYMHERFLLYTHAPTPTHTKAQPLTNLSQLTRMCEVLYLGLETAFKHFVLSVLHCSSAQKPWSRAACPVIRGNTQGPSKQGQPRVRIICKLATCKQKCKQMSNRFFLCPPLKMQWIGVFLRLAKDMDRMKLLSKTPRFLSTAQICDTTMGKRQNILLLRQ